MDDESIARHFANKRPGYHLVSYRRVIAPLFRVTVKTLTLLRNPLPRIAEFILKSVDAGMTTTDEIAGLLGLDKRLVHANIEPLVTSGDLLVTASQLDRRHRLMFTDKGRETLAEGKLNVPEERDVVVYVDGITHEVFDTENDGQFLKPFHLQDNEYPELDVYPPRFKPSLPEMRIALTEHIRKLMTEKEFKIQRDVLEIISVGRADRRFRDDVLALVYKPLDNTLPPVVTFAIDGVLNERYEQIVQRGDSAKRLGLIPSNFESAEALFREILGDEILASLPPPQETAELVSQTETASENVTRLKEKIEKSDSQSEQSLLRQQLQEAREQLVLLQAMLDAYDVRSVECYDHPKYLLDTLKTAKERILIISPWIKGNVVNRDFMTLLRQALDRKVEVFIGYGFPNDEPWKNDQEVIRRLNELANRKHNLHFKHLGNTHAKILVCDHTFIIVTSFNWLSFKGDPDRTFRDERGLFTSIPEKIEQFFSDYSSQITAT
jgi:DNA-binding MarR family transcriptional regulator